MDMGKEMLFEEARRMRIDDVKIQFVSPTCFNVLDRKDGQVKYIGCIEPELDCTCMSFIQGNKERYMVTHSRMFECKHIMKAKEILGK